MRRRFLPGERLAPADLALESASAGRRCTSPSKRLALEGLVVIEPRRGTAVRRVSTKDVAEVAVVRTLIEVHAVGVAAQRVTSADLTTLRGFVSRLDEILEAKARPPQFEDWSAANARLHRYLVHSPATRRCCGSTTG